MITVQEELLDTTNAGDRVIYLLFRLFKHMLIFTFGVVSKFITKSIQYEDLL